MMPKEQFQSTKNMRNLHVKEENHNIRCPKAFDKIQDLILSVYNF